MSEAGETVWERLGAASGVVAALLLLLAEVLTNGRVEPVIGDAATAVAELQAHDALWEWNTMLRLIGGLLLVWAAGSIAGRIRAWEGEPGRLAGIFHATAVLWGGVWLMSALFNSASLTFVRAGDDAAAYASMVYAHEAAMVLTPAIAFAMTQAAAFAMLRFGGFPRAYQWVTAALSGLVIVMAVTDWYGAADLSLAIMLIALVWFAVTAGLSIGGYAAPDWVAGARPSEGA